MPRSSKTSGAVDEAASATQNPGIGIPHFVDEGRVRPGGVGRTILELLGNPCPRAPRLALQLKGLADARGGKFGIMAKCNEVTKKCEAVSGSFRLMNFTPSVPGNHCGIHAVARFFSRQKAPQLAVGHLQRGSLRHYVEFPLLGKQTALDIAPPTKFESRSDAG